MNPQPETAISLWFVVAVLGASAGVWGWAFARWRRRLPAVAYQAHRPAPWCGWDVFAAALVYFLTVDVAIVSVRELAGEPWNQPLPQRATTEHIVAQLIEGGQPWMFLVAFFAAGIVAPVVEEFLFRVLLQGWLEAGEHRRRRLLPWLRRVMPRGAGPVVLTSLLFAWMHYRVASDAYRPEFIAGLLIGLAAASLLTMALAIVLMRRRTGATAADLGWDPSHATADVRLGLLVFVAVAPLAYMLQIGMSWVLPENVAPDPFALFFFALALGLLYQRTHRIMPSLVLHMALNLTSLAMAMAITGGK